MNYYEENRQQKYINEQIVAFKKLDIFKQTEAFKTKGQQAKVWIAVNSREVVVAESPEFFSDAVISWDDWKKTNYSPVEELEFNTWVIVQKEAFKKTNEYKNSEFARRVNNSLLYNGRLLFYDDIKLSLNGDIELYTGEKFKQNDIDTVPWDKFKEVNYYQEVKFKEWNDYRNVLSRKGVEVKQIIGFEDWCETNYSKKKELEYNDKIARLSNNKQRRFIV